MNLKKMITVIAGFFLVSTSAMADGYDRHGFHGSHDSHGYNSGNIAGAIIGGMVIGAAINSINSNNYNSTPVYQSFPVYPHAQTYYTPETVTEYQWQTVCNYNGYCYKQKVAVQVPVVVPEYYQPAPVINTYPVYGWHHWH